MNASEIQAAYPAARHLTSTTTIAEHDFIVQFLMDKSDRLYSVQLRKEFDEDFFRRAQELVRAYFSITPNIVPKVAQDMADMNASRAYETLKELLVQKYGRPTTEQSKDRDHGAVWHIPNSKIHLSFDSARLPSSPAIIFIAYYKPGDTDKL